MYHEDREAMLRAVKALDSQGVFQEMQISSTQHNHLYTSANSIWLLVFHFCWLHKISN